MGVRQATPEDASAIARVHVASWKTTYRGIMPDAYLDGLDYESRVVRWRGLLSAADPVFVAECAGQIVGFATGGAIRDPLDGYDAELYAIYLLEEFQGKGIGRGLLAEVAKRADADGFRSMAVWVIEANAAAWFYERTGAVRIGAKQREFGGAMLPLVAYGWSNLKALIGGAR